MVVNLTLVILTYGDTVRVGTSPGILLPLRTILWVVAGCTVDIGVSPRLNAEKK